MPKKKKIKVQELDTRRTTTCRNLLLQIQRTSTNKNDNCDNRRANFLKPLQSVGFVFFNRKPASGKINLLTEQKKKKKKKHN